MNSFTVKFWIVNGLGYQKQKIESVNQQSSLHKKAVEFIIKKYKLKKKDIISVKYQ